MTLYYRGLFKQLTLLLISLANFRTKFLFKLGMMWHPRKIHSHFDLLILISLHHSKTAYQISGRNFFQVGDDVTTCIFESSIAL
ncbi:hypothetical protein Hanom_Chr12g01123721 [Helianthus anomalus]